MEIPKGLFLNAPRANCSIYESGRMMYDSLVLSERYRLDYMELTEAEHDIPDSYHFYAFNYHHIRMSWLDTSSVQQLPGFKLTFVLETLPNDPFVFCPSDAFDAYCALDPTMNSSDVRVYAFPRPLEAVSDLPSYEEPTVPVIGTFGFATQGKGFDRVVAAASSEFDRAIVRINIPASDFARKKRSLFTHQDYAGHLEDLCRKAAKTGIDVIVTHEFMSKPALINWCAMNTLNCFLYDRDMPGLSATTDQAIASGRPLSVSDNPTFRHILQYVDPYPVRSLKESIVSSASGVRRMQEDWSPRNFAKRFETVIADAGLFSQLPLTPPSAGQIRLAKTEQNKVSEDWRRRFTRKARRVVGKLQKLHGSRLVRDRISGESRQP
jgi:hypothetical protein